LTNLITHLINRISKHHPVDGKRETKGRVYENLLIFGTGSTSCVITILFSKLCCANAHYKAPKKLDAIALLYYLTPLTCRMTSVPSPK
jgi:hypothetical protein